MVKVRAFFLLTRCLNVPFPLALLFVLVSRLSFRGIVLVRPCDRRRIFLRNRVVPLFVAFIPRRHFAIEMVSRRPLFVSVAFFVPLIGRLSALVIPFRRLMMVLLIVLLFVKCPIVRRRTSRGRTRRIVVRRRLRPVITMAVLPVRKFRSLRLVKRLLLLRMHMSCILRSRVLLVAFFGDGQRLLLFIFIRGRSFMAKLRPKYYRPYQKEDPTTGRPPGIDGVCGAVNMESSRESVTVTGCVVVTASTENICYCFMAATGKDICVLLDTSEVVSIVGSRLAGVDASFPGASFIFVAVHPANKHKVDVGTTTLVLYNFREHNGTKTPDGNGHKSFDISEVVTEVTASDGV